MNKDIKEALATILNDVINSHEFDYEQILDKYGIDSIEANQHIYNLARNLWAEFEIDLIDA
jgi:acyl carrier protein